MVQIGLLGTLGTLGVPGLFSRSCTWGDCCTQAKEEARSTAAWRLADVDLLAKRRDRALAVVPRGGRRARGGPGQPHRDGGQRPRLPGSGASARGGRLGPARRHQPRRARGGRPRRRAGASTGACSASSSGVACPAWRSSTWATSSSPVSEGRQEPPDDGRHFGLVVDDPKRCGTRRRARESTRSPPVERASTSATHGATASRWSTTARCSSSGPPECNESSGSKAIEKTAEAQAEIGERGPRVNVKVNGSD